MIKERIVNALASGDSKSAIARALGVSRNTVQAIEEQQWSKVEQRKARIAAQSERNATRAAERISAKLESTEDIRARGSSRTPGFTERPRNCSFNGEKHRKRVTG